MGTDIHGVIQRRYNGGRYATIGEIEGDRNYRVFAMLADVRNGYGFAGVRTFEPLTPVAPRRGLPDDLGRKGEYERTEHDADDFGDHSFSWLTLREVLDWPHWDDKIHMIGVLDRGEYERMRVAGDSPQSWSGGVSGPNVVQTTVAAIEGNVAPSDWTHVHYEWDEPFRNYAKTFRLWLDYMDAKFGWSMEKDPAAIRLVFGFDS